MGKLIKIFILTFFLLLNFFFVKGVHAQTNLIDCVPFDSPYYCGLGPQIPNPDCADGYEVPDCGPRGAEDCCTMQTPSGNCNPVDCVPAAGVTFTPTPTPLAPKCDTGDICTSVDVPVCVALGGSNRACSKGDGSLGSCCQPDPGLGNQGCSSDYPTCKLYSGWPDSCAYYAGIPVDSCEDSNGQPGNCCVPHTPCQGGGLCDWVGAGGCESNGGTTRNCVIPASGDLGNCCLPGENTYGCVSNGVNCWSDIAGSTIPYTCTANWGYCASGDPSCVACEDIVCPAGMPADDCTALCMDGNPRLCVEQNPTTGYWCVDTITGCYPCFDHSTNPECNPPEYGSGTPVENLTNCTLACTGVVPIKWACNPGFGCNESDYGYKNRGECSATCGNLAFPKIFCVGDDPSKLTSNAGSGKIATGIGCIPVIDNNREIPIGFGTFFIEWGIGVGGGIGFLMMIIAGFMILTSAGDPKKLAAGKELLTAAIAGVLFMVLGLYILRVVGVDVLGIFPSAIGGGGSGGGGHVR